MLNEKGHQGKKNKTLPILYFYRTVPQFHCHKRYVFKIVVGIIKMEQFFANLF